MIRSRINLCVVEPALVNTEGHLDAHCTKKSFATAYDVASLARDIHQHVHFVPIVALKKDTKLHLIPFHDSLRNCDGE